MKLYKNNLSIKLFVLTLIPIVLFILMSVFCIIPDTREDIYELKKQQTRELAEVGLSIVKNYYEEYREGEMTEEEAKHAAMEKLQSIRFGERMEDYYWITNYEPEMIMHPFTPELEGEYVGDYKDPDGVPLFREMVEVVQEKGEGYVEYQWQYYDEDRIEPKLSYVIGFEEWEWIIGTGIYIEDIEPLVVSRAWTIMGFVGGIALLALLGSLYWGQKKIAKPIKETSDFADNIAKGDFSVEVPKHAFNRHDEIGVMAKSFHRMQKSLKKMFSARKQAEEALRKSEERYRILVENAKEGILVAQDELVKYVNSEITKIMGYSKEEILETPFVEYIHPHDREIVLEKHQKRLQGMSKEHRYEFRVVRKDGSIRWLQISTGLIEWEGNPATLNLLSDITERKEAEDKIYYLSFHDNLTGLYNRAFLEEEMKRLDTERQMPISIIMIDLNGLKLVNDTYGHSTGDEMLIQTADILKKSCRQEDIIGRWGGDEFVILLPQVKDRELESICERIKQNSQKVKVKELPISLAVGQAVKRSKGESLNKSLKKAEDNMYKHKLAESRSARSAVLNTLLKTLETKSYETELHIQRMLRLARRIGEKIELPESELNRLQVLITLHDIGKINIPEEILTKKEALTDSEWEMMKAHSEIGYRIALATEEFAYVGEDILSHHERWDGTGYPRGLKGKKIPVLSRITAIVDAYEVMANGRPYKEPMTKEEIVAEFKRCAGTQFDPELVEIFLSVLEE